MIKWKCTTILIVSWTYQVSVRLGLQSCRLEQLSNNWKKNNHLHKTATKYTHKNTLLNYTYTPVSKCSNTCRCVAFLYLFTRQSAFLSLLWCARSVSGCFVRKACLSKIMPLFYWCVCRWWNSIRTHRNTHTHMQRQREYPMGIFVHLKGGWVIKHRP